MFMSLIENFLTCSHSKFEMVVFFTYLQIICRWDIYVEFHVCTLKLY